MLLPSINDQAEFDRRLREPGLFDRAIDEICRRHHLAGSMERFATGSTVVCAIGNHVIKLFGTMHSEHASTELMVLQHLHNYVDIPSPGVLASEDVDGWPYLVMQRMPGASLAQVWGRMSYSEQSDICRAAGSLAAQLHAVTVDEQKLPHVRWQEFIAHQIAACAERQRRLGLDEHWVEQIDPFLASVDLDADQFNPVLLHTELMHEHLLVDRIDNRWQITGLIDFEPSMVGAREYELASVAVFIACGDPNLFNAFISGYGDIDVTKDLARRVMAYLLLHRYSSLRWYLELLPHDGAMTLDALVERWITGNGQLIMDN